MMNAIRGSPTRVPDSRLLPNTLHVFIDLESFKVDYRRLLSDPVPYLMERLNLPEGRFTFFGYSTGLGQASDLLVSIANRSPNFVYYVVPKKLGHEVVDKAIVQDAMFVAAKCRIMPNMSLSGIIIVSNDSDFYELSGSILRLGTNVSLMSDEARKDDLWRTFGEFNFTQLVCPEGISTLRTPGGALMPNTSGVGTLSPTLVNNRSICYGEIVWGNAIEVWSERVYGFLNGTSRISGMLLPGGLPVSIYLLSQLGQAIANVVVLPNGVNSRRYARFDIISILVASGIVRPVSSRPIAMYASQPFEEYNTTQVAELSDRSVFDFFLVPIHLSVYEAGEIIVVNRGGVRRM